MNGLALTLPPLLISGWLISGLKIIVLAVTAGIALLLILLLMRLIWRIHWKSQTISHYLHLFNAGNVDSLVELGAVAPGRELKFNYVLDGLVLPRLNAPKLTRGTNGNNGSHADPENHPGNQAQTLVGSPPAKPSASGQSLAGAAASVGEKAEAASGISLLLIGIVGTLGSLIPGPMGESLKKQSTEMQAVKAKVTSQIAKPVREVKQAQHLQDQVGQLKSSVGSVGPTQGKAALAFSASDPVQPVPLAAAVPLQSNVNSASDPAGELPAAAQLPVTEYVLLPAIPPAGSLALEIRVDSIHPHWKGSAYYWLYTRQRIVAATPPPAEIQPTKRVAEVTFPGMAPVFRLVSAVLTVAVIGLNFAWAFALLSWLLPVINRLGN